MQRRYFLKLTASSSFVLSFPGVPGLFQDASYLKTLAHPELLTILGNEQVRGIGLAYRDRFPRENDPETLIAALTADGERPQDLTGSTLQSSLARSTRNDFANGHTVQVNGWMLALTEARQSALYSLLYT